MSVVFNTPEGITPSFSIQSDGAHILLSTNNGDSVDVGCIQVASMAMGLQVGSDNKLVDCG